MEAVKFMNNQKQCLDQIKVSKKCRSARTASTMCPKLVMGWLLGNIVLFLSLQSFPKGKKGSCNIAANIFPEEKKGTCDAGSPCLHKSQD